MRKVAFVCLIFFFAAPVFAQEESPARIQFINLTGDVLTDMDVYLNGELFLESIPVSVFSEFLPTTPGNYEIGVIESGTSLEDGYLVSKNMTFAANEWSVIALVGSIAGNFVDLNQVHMDVSDMPDGTITVYFYNPFVNETYTALLDDFDPLPVNPFNTVPINIAQGAHTLTITSENADPIEAELTAEIYHHYLVTRSPSTGLMIEDINFSTAIRVNQLVEDMPPAALLVNGESRAVLGFQSRAESLILPYGTYDLALVTDNVLEPETYSEFEAMTLEPDAVYTITLTGLLADGSLQADVETLSTDVYTDNRFLVDGRNAVINLHHEISDAPPMDVILPDGTVLIQNLVFRDEAAVLDLPAGDYDLFITVSGEPENILFDLTDITLRGGNVYTFYAIGTLEAVQSGTQGLFIEIQCVNPAGCEP